MQPASAESVVSNSPARVFCGITLLSVWVLRDAGISELLPSAVDQTHTISLSPFNPVRLVSALLLQAAPCTWRPTPNPLTRNRGLRHR